ncbi:MAG: rane fusion protein multidrug efflux system [Thermoanaerobaculia bacterium]|jgi:membrane fusion protein (multidrug efflux system)|nr:rane fusion protein multidrug efflux system [Thermoanaerobaculia bacterium]
MLLMLGAVIAFIAIIGGFKYFQIKKAMAGMSYQPPPEAVTTVVARQEEWNSSAKAIGTVAAVQGVTVSADLPGVVERIDFDSGRPVSKGQILVVLDAKQERAQLASAEAQRQLNRVNLERMRGMMAAKIIPEATYDTAAAEAKQADAKVAELAAMIARKTIRAPFDGVLGLREINLGQYLAGGAAIVSLQSLRPVYVNFSVPQQEMSHLAVGSDIQVDASGTPETGKVTAFGAVIDEATRNGQVQASFANRDGRLRPGMFVEAHFAHGATTSAIALPASAISYAPFGDSVFIVEDVKDPKGGKTYRGVRQQFVKLGETRGDQVAVLTGVKAGEEVVTSGVFKLRPGAAVQVNNAVQPGNNPKPRPEDS